MTEAHDLLKAIPRERWAGALAMLLVQGMTSNPMAFTQLVVQGEDVFVAAGVRTDQYGLTRREYKHIYRRLCRAAKRLGLSTVVQ